MSQISARLSLPYIQPAQAQKHITHNEAVELLDLIVQLTVQDFNANTPPADPADAETWGIGPAPTGAWTGEAGKLASFRNGGWLFVTPATGWQAYNVTAANISVYDGENWVSAGSTPVLENLTGLGINATSDSTNKLSVAADATLLNNEGAGHQLKINKAATPDTASLLFQSNWSGRAEMGLAGSDDFALKVSDGVSWFTAITAVGTTGALQINQLLNLAPRATPGTASAGDVYFDSTTSKLRCFDGTAWQNLF